MLILRVGLKACRLLRIVFLAHTSLGCPTNFERSQRARTDLQEHLPLQANGYKCTTEQLLDVLLGVAANHSTLEAICADLVGTPDADTIRQYLNKQLKVEGLVPGTARDIAREC